MMHDIIKYCHNYKPLLQPGNIFRLLVDTSHEIITILARDGTILFKNNASENVLGYTSGEMTGYNEHDYIHHDDKIHLSKILESQNSGSTLPAVEYRCRTIDGGWKFLRSTVIPVKDAHGGNTCFILHSHDMSGQKHLEEELRKSLREKEVLMIELHHRVKNNLQIILSILSLQSHKVNDSKYYTYMEESRLRIYAISLVHEKLYSSENMSHIDFYGYLVELINELFISYKISRQLITVRLEVDEVKLDIVKAVPCAMIINELLINAMTHAFHKGRCGMITVVIKTNHEGSNVLRVTDNGAGLPKDFEISNSKTLGMEIIQVLTKQINGTVDINGDNGTTVQITF